MNLNHSILLKPNSRLILEAENHDSFALRLDNIRSTTFFPMTEFAYQYISAFLKNGKLIEELNQIDKVTPDEASKSRIMTFVDNLIKHGFIDYHFLLDGVIQMIIRPLSRYFKHESLQAHASAALDRFVLSRFAYLHHEKDNIILECPLAPFSVSFSIPILSKFLPYLTGKIQSDGISDLSNDDKTILEILLNICIEHDLLKPLDEPEPQIHRNWEFHDILFHSKSRRGRFDDALRFGATYRFSHEIRPPETFKDIQHADPIPLYKPHLHEIERTDPSFTSVLERRRSARNFHSSSLLSISHLGEFLYRSIAIRNIVKAHPQEAIYKVYPAPGAIHEIEFYLVVGSCEGLVQDIYYYHPEKHALFRKHASEHQIKEILINSRASMGKDAQLPHIVFVLTSRFEKTTWKYEKMSYRSTLVTMGAIFQTMSLVATAMNIGSCIIGAGDSLMFAHAIGLNAMEENAIGEFALGRLSTEGKA